MFTKFYTWQTGPNCNWSCHTSSHKKLRMQSRDHSCIMSAKKTLACGYRVSSANDNFWFNVYRIVASTKTCYYSENQLFVQRSQYIMTENPLHKQSEKAKTCHWPRRASTRDYTVICFQILWSEKQKQQAWKTTQLQIFHQKKSEGF